MAGDTTVSAVNDLIETCTNSEKGFRTAADALTDPRTTYLVQQYSRQRDETARELEAEVGRHGGTAERMLARAGER